MKILRLLNNIFESVLNYNKKESNITPAPSTVQEDKVIITAKEEPLPSSKPDLEYPHWQHLSTEQMYKLIIPDEAFNPQSEEAAFMCTVIHNKNTGESRLIPYMNIPIMMRTIVELRPANSMASQTHEWEFDIEDH